MIGQGAVRFLCAQLNQRLASRPMLFPGCCTGSQTYRRACPAEFNVEPTGQKATPNALCVKRDRVEPLPQRSTGTKVTGAVAQLR